MMSPNMLLVTITSKGRGSRTSCRQSASTYICCASIWGCSPLTSLNTRCHKPPAWVMAFDLSHMSTRRRGEPSSFGCSLAIFERVADDALDSLAGVDVFLNRDFVGSALFENAAGIGVNPLRVFADHDKIHILRLDAFQRAQRRIEQAHWAHVGVKIHFEAHAEQNFFGVDIGFHARIAEGAGQNGIEIAVEHGESVGRDGHSVAEIAIGAPVEFAYFDVRTGRPDRFESLGDYLLPNSISGNHGDAFLGSLLRVHGRKA